MPARVIAPISTPPRPKGPIIALHHLQALGLADGATPGFLPHPPFVWVVGRPVFLPFEVIHSPLCDERQL